jgi:hypothetical protein
LFAGATIHPSTFTEHELTQAKIDQADRLSLLGQSFEEAELKDHTHLLKQQIDQLNQDKRCG